MISVCGSHIECEGPYRLSVRCMDTYLHAMLVTVFTPLEYACQPDAAASFLPRLCDTGARGTRHIPLLPEFGLTSVQSAKANVNVEEAFQAISRDSKKRYDASHANNDPVSRLAPKKAYPLNRNNVQEGKGVFFRSTLRSVQV